MGVGAAAARGGIPARRPARQGARQMREGLDNEPKPGRSRRGPVRALRLLAIVVGGVAGYLLFGDYLSFEFFRENRDALADWRDRNLSVAILVYMVIYILAVAFSVPGAIWLTISGGFLFGLGLGVAVTVASATVGATLIFLAAKTALRETLTRNAGPWLRRAEDEFRENEVSFMLLMRLVPAIPFFAVNIAAALLGVRLTTYVWTTLIGIFPGSGVYTWVGAGVDDVIARGETPNLGLIFEWSILGPILGLCALATLPIVIRKLRGRQAAGGHRDD